MGLSGNFSWLADRWEGSMAGGTSVADGTFTPPTAGLIAGARPLVADDRIPAS